MTRLFHCNTHYNCDPPVDINPLILEKYKEGRILVLTAREAQSKRIYTLLNQDGFYPKMHLVCYGWWEAENMGLVEEGEVSYAQLTAFDAVVIVSRKQIHDMFLPLVQEIEEFLACEVLLPA